MKKFWIVSAMVAGSLVVAALLVAGPGLLKPTTLGLADQSSVPTAINPPWQVQSDQLGQLQVMGVKLGTSTSGAMPSSLTDVLRTWGRNVDVAIIAAPGEAGALEAFVDPAQAGFINGKLIMTFSVPADQIAAMRERAIKSDFMESTTRKYTLAPADLEASGRYTLSALAFVPQAKLDEGVVISRFGTPAERIRSTDEVEHFLYPDKGLDVVLNRKGKDVLQYVGPADFHKLRDPLRTVSKP